jgi:hypothetical protein
MNATSTFKKVITATVGAAAVALAGSGCTAVTTGVAMPDQSALDSMSASAIDSSACAQVDAQKVDIPAGSAAEPQMRIPQPDGWEITSEFGDRDLVRFTMVNPQSVNAEGIQDVVVVVAEEVPDVATEVIFDDGYATLVDELEKRGLPTNMTRTAGTVCGNPAETSTYEDSAGTMGAAARGEAPAASFLQVVAETGGRTYLVFVLAIGADDTPAYQRDAETILTGFEVLPPADAAI